MTVQHHKTKGRFYIGNSESQWQVVLCTPAGTVSELWPEDEEPETIDELPSTVLDLIEERLNSYWINTGREDKRKTIAAMRETIDAADREWLQQRITKAKEDLARWEQRLEALGAEA